MIVKIMDDLFIENIIILDVTVHPSKALGKDSWHEHAALFF